MEKWGAAIKELCAVGLGLWAIVLACIQEVEGESGSKKEV